MLTRSLAVIRLRDSALLTVTAAYMVLALIANTGTAAANVVLVGSHSSSPPIPQDTNLYDWRARWVSVIGHQPLNGTLPPWQVEVGLFLDENIQPNGMPGANPTCSIGFEIDQAPETRTVLNPCVVGEHYVPISPPMTGIEEWVNTNLQDASNGPHTVTITAYDEYDGESNQAAFPIDIDNTSPEPPALTGPVGWQAGTTTVTANAIAAGPSGIAGQNCTAGGQTKWYAGSTAHVQVTGNGTVPVSCSAVTGAGVEGPPGQINVFLDNSRPTGYWRPIQWATDPRHIVLHVADSESGVAGGQISLKWPDGTIQPLPTTFDAAAGSLTGFVDDDHLLAGTYEASAVVTDNVGNQATITTQLDGTPLFLPIPLRTPTQLLVGNTAKLERRCAARGGKTRCRVSTEPAGAGRLTLASGQLGTISGVVETGSGQPIADAPVQVSSAPTGYASAIAATVRAGPDGRFTYLLPAGPSRTVTFEFPGTAVLHDASGQAQVFVRGSSTFRMNKASSPPGGWITFSGRVRGGYIPPGGALVQLQFKDFGVWNQFGPVIHTDRRGRWISRRRLQAGAAQQTYEFQAVLVRENGWPFLPAKTRAVPFTVT
jgi:hypothetical protein